MTECFCFFCKRPDRPIDTDRDWYVLAAAGGWRPSRDADAVFHERCFAEFLRDDAHDWYGGYKVMGGRYGELSDADCYECRGSATARIDITRLRHARAMLKDSGECGMATLLHLDCLEHVMALPAAERDYVVVLHQALYPLDGR